MTKFSHIVPFLLLLLLFSPKQFSHQM